MTPSHFIARIPPLPTHNCSPCPRCRCLATAPQVAVAEEEKPKPSSTIKESRSFTMNLFRGTVDVSQVFPYPEVLNEEQKDTLKMFIDPTTKFFEVSIHSSNYSDMYSGINNIIQ